MTSAEVAYFFCNFAASSFFIRPFKHDEDYTNSNIALLYEHYIVSKSFFETYSTLHGTVPFDKIKTGDYVPAIREGIRRQNAEIEAIIRNPEVPTFANTVLAYEKSGEMLHRVGTVFGNLLSAETDDDLQELAKEIMPMMSEHENNISLNEELFARIKAVYEQQDKETLNPEQHKLLEDIYNGFVRNGANLLGEDKEKYRALCKELSLLTLQFSENNLKETNDYKLVITDKSQLAGLPESAVEAAAETAGEKRRRRLGIHPAGSQLWPFPDLCRQP